MEQSILNRNKRVDKIARWVISVGGIFILVCVIGMLVMMLQVTLPLFSDSDSERLTRLPLPDLKKSERVLALGTDQYLETGYWVGSKGEIRFLDFVQGTLTDSESISDGQEITNLKVIGQHNISFVQKNGTARLVKISFAPEFIVGEDRKIIHQTDTLLAIPATQFAAKIKDVSIYSTEEMNFLIALLEDGRMQLLLQASSEDEGGFLDDYEDEDESTDNTEQIFNSSLISPEEGDHFTSFAVNLSGTVLYAATQNGKILRWDISDPEEIELKENNFAFPDHRAITSLTFVYGEESLAVGDATGQVSTWFLANNNAGTDEKQLTLIHSLSKQESAITQLAPSLRHKSILSLDQDGILNLDHMTSETNLLTFTEEGGISHFSFSARGNGLVTLNQKQEITLWKVDTPHPESSWKTFFGKVWYESYEKPDYIWQSSSGSDDFEPKLSLIPLIFGSLKGTFYAMIFALPLGIFGAIYTNEFGGQRFREIVKPAVEVTAAIPSVIIGFMAALWLAPLIDAGLLSFFLFWPILLSLFVLFLGAWSKLRERQSLQFIEKGMELSVIIPLVLLSLFLAYQLAPVLEAAWFGGDFKNWIYESITQDYDQRNSIIISFALGFIVIPFIFTMTDDALGSVPPSLKAASSALGASRWQTLWLVLLPSASPGIFAGVILGMGRAIGETMIVLMATGNTPIMDISIFDGMRTLSANIAVEIPEAPIDGTLYRTLFMSAVILFGFTFIINSVAEVVRTSLRKKYGEF